MSEAKHVKSGNDNLAASLKVAVWAVVLACVVLAVETPQLVMAPGESVAIPEKPVPAAVTSATTEYFPAQFPAPKGEAEPAPATF